MFALKNIKMKFLIFLAFFNSYLLFIISRSTCACPFLNYLLIFGINWNLGIDNPQSFSSHQFLFFRTSLAKTEKELWYVFQNLCEAWASEICSSIHILYLFKFFFSQQGIFIFSDFFVLDLLKTQKVHGLISGIPVFGICIFSTN